jgi:hypothetical protein
MEHHQNKAVHNKNDRKKFTDEGRYNWYYQIEWQEYYDTRFNKHVKKQDKIIEEKRDKHYNEIMRNQGPGDRSSRGLKIEDRLLQEGQKYQDKINHFKETRSKSTSRMDHY